MVDKNGSVNWTDYKMEVTSVTSRMILKSKMVDGRHFANTKNSITLKPFARESPNFIPSFASPPCRRFWCQKWNFAKSKMAANAQMTFINIALISIRLFRNVPNLARIIHSTPAFSIFHQSLELGNSIWPLAPLWKKIIAMMNIFSVVSIPRTYNKTANINAKTKS